MGPVIAVGGGGTPDSVVREGVRLAREIVTAQGQQEGEIVVLVIPNASQREDRGIGSCEMWIEHGADQALNMDDLNLSQTTGLLGRAHVIWMSGGSQSKLLDELERAGLLDDVRAAHERGAVIGGTSAGAAVLGRLTIANSPEPGPYRTGAMNGRAGLSLVGDVIVDQHFAERKREGRLLTALMDAGGGVGVGVSERTAAIFERSKFRTMGEGAVLVYDARHAVIATTEAGEHRSMSNVNVSVVPPGASWSFGER